MRIILALDSILFQAVPSLSLTFDYRGMHPPISQRYYHEDFVRFLWGWRPEGPNRRFCQYPRSPYHSSGPEIQPLSGLSSEDTGLLQLVKFLVERIIKLFSIQRTEASSNALR